MSTYSVVVALHIIAAVAAYGLPLTAPLLVPYVRRNYPAALPGLHAAQYHLNQKVTGPFTVLVLAFGIYLATDGHRWSEPFVGMGIGAIVIIGVIGGGVVVPATRDRHVWTLRAPSTGGSTAATWPRRHSSARSSS